MLVQVDMEHLVHAVKMVNHLSWHNLNKLYKHTPNWKGRPYGFGQISEKFNQRSWLYHFQDEVLL